MYKELTARFAIALLCVGLSLAYVQGNGQWGPPATTPGQGQGSGQPPGGTLPQASSNPNKLVQTLLNGGIVDVLAEYGSAYPAIVFEHASLTSPIEVRLAPLWYLEEALSLNRQTLLTFVGKNADLVVFSKITADEVVYHAITLTVSGVTYRFRSDDGKPLWNPSGKIKDRIVTLLETGTTRNLGGEVISVTPSLFSGELTLTMLGDDGMTHHIRLAAAEDLLCDRFRTAQTKSRSGSLCPGTKRQSRRKRPGIATYPASSTPDRTPSDRRARRWSWVARRAIAGGGAGRRRRRRARARAAGRRRCRTAAAGCTAAKAPGRARKASSVAARRTGSTGGIRGRPAPSGGACASC